MSFSVLALRPRPTRNSAQQTHSTVLAKESAQELVDYSASDTRTVLADLTTTANGLRDDQIDDLRRQYGRNDVRHDRPAPAIVQFAQAFKNPFILILVFLALIMSGPTWCGQTRKTVPPTRHHHPRTDDLCQCVPEVLAGIPFDSGCRALKAMVTTTVAATRKINNTVVTAEIPIEQLLPGDVVQLAAGDMIPADVRIIRAKDLQVNQSMLSGESMPAEKSAEPSTGIDVDRLLEAENIGFMGTSVVSGSGTAVAVHTGKRTYFGAMTAQLASKRPETSFDVGVRSVSYLLIKFMLIMVPAVFIINGLTKDWSQALLFGVATAVGLTPEMLPLIVTANLAKGALHMSRKKVIVKQINAIQNFGAMDVLCTDKTGTLTEDRIVLGEHLDTAGRKSEDVLRLAAVNSVNQTGLRSLLDDAVIEAAGPEVVEEISRRHGLVDEIPFDFKRRRLSVVVDHGDADLIVTKGAVEELLSVCESVELDGVTHQLTPGWLARVDRLVAELNGQGKRVLAVATKTVVEEQRREYSTADEEGMTLVGLLAFLDPPKESAAGAIEALASHGVAVKVVTGDNELVAETVCGKVGIDVGTVVSGAEIEALSDDALDELVQRTTVFAKTDPMQKARIVESLRRVGHTVGFLGDGVNDAPALRAADVGISVDTAADIARESADIILLEKDLGVLEQGVIEGRRTFGNIQKYIKMTASSNFGNVFSVLVASALLPFIPMIPVVLLLQNLIYDLSMLTIPWDRVDDDFLAKPRKWETKSLRRFMVFIGPISSIFDISTFALMCSCSPPTLPSMQRCSNRVGSSSH